MPSPRSQRQPRASRSGCSSSAPVAARHSGTPPASSRAHSPSSTAPSSAASSSDAHQPAVDLGLELAQDRRLPSGADEAGSCGHRLLHARFGRSLPSHDRGLARHHRARLALTIRQARPASLPAPTGGRSNVRAAVVLLSGLWLALSLPVARGRRSSRRAWSAEVGTETGRLVLVWPAPTRGHPGASRRRRDACVPDDRSRRHRWP